MDPIKVRPRWLSVLPHSQPDQLLAHWQPLKLHPSYEQLRAPETGLTRQQARMGRTGRRFILGDTVVTRAMVRLEDGICGYSYVLTRNKAHAKLCALIDGLLQQSNHAEMIQQTNIVPLAAAREEQQPLRSREIASSRVDFFTLVRGDNS